MLSKSPLGSALAAACVFAGGVAASAAPAAAAPASLLELTCTAASTVTYSPGLTLAPTLQTVTFDVSYSGCTSPLGTSGVTSGSRHGSFQDIRSCLALPASATQSFPVDWNAGASSQVSGTTQSVDAAGQVVHIIIGPVMTGQFAGDTYVEEINQASLDLLQCALGTGVKSQTGVGVVTLT
ncbi:hypothetical protein ACFY8O_29975 [Streptomyces argenteolus]|uniref:Uncharacterized protein n=1 Tax=Streptomyces argenteolus TaxID=67274 RepID=A0ABW6XEF9_9ACTN